MRIFTASILMGSLTLLGALPAAAQSTSCPIGRFRCYHALAEALTFSRYNRSKATGR